MKVEPIPADWQQQYETYKEKRKLRFEMVKIRKEIEDADNKQHNPDRGVYVDIYV